MGERGRKNSSGVGKYVNRGRNKSWTLLIATCNTQERSKDSSSSNNNSNVVLLTAICSYHHDDIMLFLCFIFDFRCYHRREKLVGSGQEGSKVHGEYIYNLIQSLRCGTRSQSNKRWDNLQQ